MYIFLIGCIIFIKVLVAITNTYFFLQLLHLLVQATITVPSGFLLRVSVSVKLNICLAGLLKQYYPEKDNTHLKCKASHTVICTGLL